jgi:hypothetical protein
MQHVLRLSRLTAQVLDARQDEGALRAKLFVGHLAADGDGSRRVPLGCRQVIPFQGQRAQAEPRPADADVRLPFIDRRLLRLSQHLAVVLSRPLQFRLSGAHVAQREGGHERPVDVAGCPGEFQRLGEGLACGV